MAVATGVDVGVASTLVVGVGVVPGDHGTGGSASAWGSGLAWTNQSRLSSLVSMPLPSGPPGSRSRLEPAGGAGAGDPSTKPLAAVPQAIESMTVPSPARSATAPPAAASPPLYVASAPLAKLPAASANRRCWPGSNGVGVVQAALRVTVPPVAVT